MNLKSTAQSVFILLSESNMAPALSLRLAWGVCWEPFQQNYKERHGPAAGVGRLRTAKLRERLHLLTNLRTVWPYE